jgi:hypothetical protein
MHAQRMHRVRDGTVAFSSQLHAFNTNKAFYVLASTYKMLAST